MSTRRAIPGHFTKMVGPHHVGISEDEARRLMANHCRDVDEQIRSLQRNPFGQVKGDDCLVRYDVHRAPVETVGNGGASLAASPDTSRLVEWLLDRVADHVPTSYHQLFDRYQEMPQAELDDFAAHLMEILDAYAGPDISFTVRQHNDTLTYGFWSHPLPDAIDPVNLQEPQP